MATGSIAIDGDNYRFLQAQVYAQTGIVLEGDKHYLFECRLAPIVRQLGLGSINDLCDLLKRRREPELAHQVGEAMTTNETYFFREPAHYDAIRTVLLPRLKQERRDTRKMRFWSAAASTGQEAYSLSMSLVEDGLREWNVEILGTDISSRVLERARAATFQQIEVNRGLPTSLLLKFFTRSGLNWQLSDAVRGLARFEQIDLRQDLRALGPFDLVFCRNVMIYFDPQTKRALLKQLHGTLFRGGWLMLGGSENTSGIEEWFERATVGNATVYIAR
jgi:chemotaxis protein methyltransferase CheR